MAIQNRRGVYSDFTPTKMVPGEFAVVNSGDPNSTSGKGVYMSFADGQAKRLVMEEDVQNEVAKATEDIAEQIEDAVADDLEAAQAAATTASTKASEAAASATQAAQTVANIIDNTLTQTGKAADAKVTGDELEGVKEDLNQVDVHQNLLCDEIPDTVQAYTFADGAVSQVTHTRDNVAIRTDAFTYGANSIAEVRTLNTGESLTITTNLITLETTVVYAAA